MNTEGYDIGNKIGSGAYGEVFKATNKATGEIVAIKKLKSEIIEDGIPATALREIVFLKQLSHENIVALKDIIMEPGKYLLVFEYMDGDLFYLLKNTPNPLGPDLVQSYTSQLLHGLAYCHALGVMHRDLKPQNLLIAKDGSLKIADFGLSRAFSFKNLTVEVVTSWYRAPEILLGSNSYTNSVDVWSAGCIICEMARNKVLFEGKCDIDQIHLIFNAFGKSWIDACVHAPTLS
jgi:serine/threonine protein kinase